MAGFGMAFVGGGLDRAAPLRARDDWADSAKVLPLWHGKVCLGDDGTLTRLAPDHPALSDAAPAILLGRADGQIWAVRDISGWTPPSLPDAALFHDPTEQVHPLIPGARFVELRGIMAQLTPLEGELAATARALTGWHISHRFCAACGQPSKPAQSGWQRVCTSCRAAHFPRTDPTVIMLIARGEEVLLGRSPGWPEGMMSCLAGFIEPGETVEDAVRREVAEETGIRVGAVRYLASQPWPFPGSLMLGCMGEAESESITLDPVELEAARWISRDELVAILKAQHPTIRAPRPGSIAAWLMAEWVG